MLSAVADAISASTAAGVSAGLAAMLPEICAASSASSWKPIITVTIVATTKAIAIPPKAYQKVCPTRPGRPGIPPLPASAYALAPNASAKPPPAALPIIAAMNGFLYFMFTPYIAGSVTPIRAVKLVERATDFSFLSLARKNTPSVAPAWPILEI
ncbi:hypothetical protein D3C73_1179060 [compost metagenome]